MKIAMIGHKRIPGREGGIEVVVEELSTRMAKLDNEVIVYNRKRKRQKELTSYNGVEIITIPTIEGKSTDAIIYSFFASIRVLFKKCDIIHYHGIGPSIMLLIPHLFKKKTIVTVHGLNYKTPKWRGLGVKVMKLGEIITAKYADEIIVLSHEQQNYFKERYNRKTIFLANGTVVNDIQKADIIKSKYSLDKDGYILFISRIVPGKGLEYLIDAYKNLNIDIPLIIAGEPTFTNDFYQMIVDKIGDDPKIKMIGFVEGKELEELYSNAKLFVFPSEAEGMPMCLLEALSYNTRCLVSDIPENLEVGANYVQSFESKNVSDLEKKLKLCLEKNVFKESSRDYIISNYNWDNITKKTLDVYKEVIK